MSAPKAPPDGMGQTAGMTTRTRCLARALGLPVLVLAVAACGGTTGSTAPSPVTSTFDKMLAAMRAADPNKLPETP